MPVSVLPTPRGPSAFLYRDPEGAPARSGVRYHAAQDWFAKPGTPVRSACTGRVVEVRASAGRSGQVFGGVVKVQAATNGWVFVTRHVEPEVRYGALVAAGQEIAEVTDWADSTADHVHLEVWRTLLGGYRLENMIDPGLLHWTEAALDKPREPRPSGAALRLALPGLGVLAGWEECEGPLRWIAAHGLRTDRAVLAWNKRRYEGAREVTNVSVNLVRRFL